MLYVEIAQDGTTRHLRYAPYLDYRPPPATTSPTRRPSSTATPAAGSPRHRAPGHPARHHQRRARAPQGGARPRLAAIGKTRAAVKARLTREINHWDHRAETLKAQEQAGKPNARLNWQEARRRADDLQARLNKRMEQLDLEEQISAMPPVVLGGAIVLPIGLIHRLQGRHEPASQAVDTQAAAARARAIVMQAERELGYHPIDRELDKVGYDIESRDGAGGQLRFIEVKGRVSGAPTITVTKNEILTSLNKPDAFILAMVEFLDDGDHRLHYLRRPFQDSGVTTDFDGASVNFPFADLIARAGAPS